MPRPTRRAAGLVAGAGVLIFLGTNVQAGWLFVIAACLLGAVAAGAVLPARMVRSLTIARVAPREVAQGDEASVVLDVAHRGRGMRLGLVVQDGFLQEVRLPVPGLRPGERAEIASSRTARRRGPQEASPVLVRSSAPFGVAHARVRVDPAGRETLVLPRVVPLGRLAFARPAPSTERAVRTAARRGTGAEYLGVREYRVGDPTRHIHWPSTAHAGVLMVREFEQEQTQRLAIVVVRRHPDAVVAVLERPGDLPLRDRGAAA